MICLLPVARPGEAIAALFDLHRPAQPALWRAAPAAALRSRVVALLPLFFLGALSAGQALAQNLTAPASPQGPAGPEMAALPPSLCPPLPADDGATAPQALLIRLDAIAPACLNHAPFHRLRGQLLMRLGEPAQALEALERALLIEPDHPGTQLDYVQVLIALGDNRSALYMVNALLARSDVPEPLRPPLQAQQRRLSEAADAAALPPPAPAAWVHRWVFTQSFSADDNLNNATRAETLTLTLPVGDIELPIDQASRPRSGLSALSGVQWTALHTQGAALWLWQTDVRHRHVADNDLRYTQLDSAATWLQAPDAPRQWVGKIATSHINWAGQHLYGALRAGLQHQWTSSSASPGGATPTTHAACRKSLGADWELRRFPASNALNGSYAGVVMALHCTGATGATGAPTAALPFGLRPQHWSTQLRLGQDNANTATRPGGTQNQWEWRNTWAARSGLHSLQAEYVWSGQADRAGYSPLLANNAPRRIQRHALRGEVAGPAAWAGVAESATVAPQWFVSLEWSAQSSNLAAFATRQTSLTAGLRWTLD